jgi:cellobiose phosphorylase
MLSQPVTLAPGQSLTVPMLLGYQNYMEVSEWQNKLARTGPAESRRMWSKRLSAFSVPGLDKWMEDECRWTLGQLFSFEFYDRVLDQHYLHLGGYDFFPDPDNPPPHLAYTIREAAENALVIAHFEPELAKSTVRWLAQMQLASGNIPKGYNYTKDRLDIPIDQKDSDTEIWFLMALCEYLDVSGDMACLDEMLTWFPEGKSSLWDHAKRAFDWITKGIGTGQHGLILILEGDWNDYLSTVGARGKGESVMNSGMAAKTFDSQARIARKKGDLAFAVQAETWRDSLRTAVAKTFDKEWFVGCYTDDGQPVASHDDRLYLNAQSWAVLGGCGTNEQRRKALQCAAKLCGTKIGMMLMSKAYSSPAPPEISWCPIPSGEGENAGIWPQTIHWTVWAMAEEGLLDLALDEWKKGTLRNHAKAFPEVPYGIFNGPDCWSSRLAGHFEGWTQYNLFSRAGPCPMSPMISWQAFAMLKIDEARRRSSRA